MPLFLPFFFVLLSGATGLIYQVIWHRYLSQFLGSDALATSLVLFLFFFFTALGYEILGKKGFSWMKNKLLLYGILEALIGLYALLSPFLFKYIEKISFSFSQGFLSQLFLSSLFLAFPTFLMGGTLPFLTQGLSHSFKASHIVHAKLYAVNSLGAFIGCLMAGFYLIEHLGLSFSLRLTGNINLLLLPLIFVLCRFYRNKQNLNFEGFVPSTSKSLKPSLFKKKNPKYPKGNSPKIKSHNKKPIFFPLKTSLFLLISFISGFYAFSLENLLIRITHMSIGSLSYTYSMIVASFIFSLSLGSFGVGYFKNKPHLKHLLILQALIFFSLYMLYLSFSQWPFILNRIRFYVFPAEANFFFYCFLILIALLVFLVLPVSFMGAQLPLLFQHLKNKKEALSPVVGRLYSINALGCALGSLMGGYLFLYFFSMSQLFQMIFWLILFNATLLLGMMFQKSKKAVLYGLFFIFPAFLLNLFLPQWKEENFVPGLFTHTIEKKSLENDHFLTKERQRDSPKILYSHLDPNAYVHVGEKKNQSRSLYINGQPNANTKIDKTVRSLNVLIPLLLSSDIKNVFIIGLGTGLSTHISTKFNETSSVDVAEISWGVIKSLPFFEKHNHGLQWNFQKTKLSENSSKSSGFSSLQNNKWKLFHGDAYRKIKQAENKKYNVIVSEPSHPWVIGVEKLYSLEFLSLAKEKLSQNGIYSQWFPLFGMNAETFLRILNNFNTVFPWTYLWATSSSTVLILSSSSPISVNAHQIRNRFQEQKQLFHKIGFTNPFSVLGLQALSPLYTKKLTHDFNKWHSFHAPKLAFESARSRFSRNQVEVQDLLRQKLNTHFNFSRLNSFLPLQASSFFLYENVSHLSPSFYRNVLSYMKKFNWNSTTSLKFQQNRIKYLYRKSYDNEETKKEVKEHIFKIYAYLSGTSAQPPRSHPFLNSKNHISNLRNLRKISAFSSKKPKSRNFKNEALKQMDLMYDDLLQKKVLQWIKVYNNLVLMQLPALWERLHQAIPKNCLRDICLKLRKKIDAQKKEGGKK